MGEFRISYVPDGVIHLKPAWLPDSAAHHWAAHPEHLDSSGHLVASVGGLLVELGDRALLIDAGFGPHEIPADPKNPLIGGVYGGQLLTSLAALGRTPEEIEAVAISHLHFDHIGWAWSPAPGGEHPAFHQASYLLTEPEWAHRDQAAAHGVTTTMLAALEPRVRLISQNEEIFPGVRVLLTPGHTPGHAAFVLTSGGQRLIAFGDALHSPIQVRYPHWSAAPDQNPRISASHRRRLLHALQQPNTLGFGPHFADVVFGRVRRDASGLAWHPEP
ncbi:MBL fold metallo-hydrolase [Streptomyces sp. NPDC017056]|uniref:MBL fold metallo-hydrolase n=1 Tax=Streptomyces sp. NPDC017056 TaxID=3364973 RepID=UPI0037877F37